MKEKLVSQFVELYADGRLPQFIVILGEEKNRKNRIITETMKKIPRCLMYTLPDVKADTIDSMLEKSMITTIPTFYVMENGENMHINVKNSILKFTEEPPENVYIILDIDYDYNLLPTLKSRATVFEMSKLTSRQLTDYAMEFDRPDVIQDVLNLADNCDDIDYLMSIDIHKFNDFVEKVYYNLGRVSLANACKMTSQLAEYDFKIFLKAYLKYVPLEYTQLIELTSGIIKDLSMKSVNKNMLIDKWIMGVRDLWNWRLIRQN